MRFIKPALGLGCFVGALFPLALSWHAVHWRYHLTRFAFWSIFSGLVLSAVALGVAGLFLFFRRRETLPTKAGLLLSIAIPASISISVASLYCLRSHAMTAAETIAKDLRIIEAAVQTSPPGGY